MGAISALAGAIGVLYKSVLSGKDQLIKTKDEQLAYREQLIAAKDVQIEALQAALQARDDKVDKALDVLDSAVRLAETSPVRRTNTRTSTGTGK